MPFAGEIIFHRVFDLGGTLNMVKARAILGPMVESGAVQATRAIPEYVSFAAPIPLNLSRFELDLKSEQGQPLMLSARLYEVGALALMLRMPVSGQELSELARHLGTECRMKGEPARRVQVFQTVADAVQPLLKPAFEEVFDVPVEAEYYTSFCLTEVSGGAELAFRDARAQIAGLLIGEPTPERLSHWEVEEALESWHSYYRDDLVITDWDAAFVIEPTGQYEDLLYTFEVANLQLLALRKYDLYLDRILERGYDEYERLSKGPPISTGRAREMVRELSEVRMDLAEVTDEVTNTAKFFGDWYVARVYMGLAGKLHINDYHRLVEEKLATLNDLYQSVLSEIDRRQNLVLEVMIVLLIIFEVVMALVRH
jgi:hypothetical protein